MKVVRILTVQPIGRVKHSNGNTVFESEHLISVTICIASISGNSKLNFYDPNMMHITIHKNYTVRIRIRSKYDPRIQSEKEKLSIYVFAISNPFSFLSRRHLRRGRM
jgi:hypothetical protein